MKTQWIPSLRVKEALAICGSLSEPGKMPCHGYALPARRCRLGSFLQQLPTAICHYCYALRGRYVFRKVQAAMEKRFASLSDPRWVDAITTLIYRSGDRYFRWHDSGDLQSLDHLGKIIAPALQGRAQEQEDDARKDRPKRTPFRYGHYLLKFTF